MSNGKMVTCANCGNERPEGTRFCGSCGTPFAQADQPPSPAEPPPTTSSTRKRRLLWVAVAAAVALLVAGGAVAAVLAMTGGNGPTQGLPMGDETTGGSDATGVDCEELTSFGDYAPALAAVQSNPAASPDEIQEVMKALSELASGAPDDVRQDFETMSETMQEMARAVSDLGLEPGDIPDEGQTDQLLGLAADLLDDTKYLDAATSVAAWFDAAVAQCSSTDTETTESGITTFGDETTTETSAVGGEGVDETCEDLLAFAVLAKDRGMSSETASVDDVEDVAAAVSELASRASAEPEEAGFLLAGEPRDSLEGLAEALESYLGVLSELGLEPGPDALVEPRVADAAERVRDNDSSLFDWFGARCSEDDKSELEEITG